MKGSYFVKTPILPAVTSLGLLSSCSNVSRSMLHTNAEWKASNGEEKLSLPPVTIHEGERVHAYKSRISFPMSYWGFIPTLVSGDSDIAKSETVTVGRGFDTYLTGKNEGRTKVYFMNGLLVDPNKSSEKELPEDYLFEVIVKKSPQ